MIVACGAAVAFGFAVGHFERVAPPSIPTVTPVVPGVQRGYSMASSIQPNATTAVRTTLGAHGVGPAQVRARASELEALARINGLDAVEAAMREPNLVTRTLLRNAALQGWAAISPEAAAEWALRLPVADRPNAMGAVFAGATEHPERAVELGLKMCASESSDTTAYGDLLVRALDEAGAYEPALAFARQVSGSGANGWVNTVFADWSTFDPDAAAAALAKIGDGKVREVAFAGLVSGWSNANPRALVTYAEQFAPSAERETALGQALSRWALQDPAATLAWINQHPDDKAFDSGLNVIATQPDLVGLRPDIAIECASSIAQRELRTSTLRMLAESWGEHDLSAAANWVAHFAAADADDRRALSEGLSVVKAAP